MLAGTDSKRVCKELCNKKFLCMFGLICAISKAPMLLEMTLCECREICGIEKGLMLLEQFYASLDKFVLQ